MAVFARLLPLVLALCTLVPAEVWARFVVACQEPDGCCCRKDDDRGRDGPVAERVDCCDAPCEAEATATPAVTASRLLFGLASVARLELDATPSVDGCAPASPSQEPRGPPRRVHASVQRWIV